MYKRQFQNIDPVPLGSASIGQVHKAVLKDGREVVVKIQRPKIKEIMKQDIFLCKKAMFIMKVVRPSGDAVDFIIVLDEMWEPPRENLISFRKRQIWKSLRNEIRILNMYPARKSYPSGLPHVC